MKSLGLLLIVLIGLGGYWGWYRPTMEEKAKQEEKLAVITVESKAIIAGESLPAKYTCMADDVNPDLEISSIPAEAESMAIVMEDEDVVENFTHWLVWNMDPNTSIIGENMARIPGKIGKNSFNNEGWNGPCPTVNEEHHYRFVVYALDKELDLAQGTNRVGFNRAIKDHILGVGRLKFSFSRTSNKADTDN